MSTLEPGTFGIFPAKLCCGMGPHEQLVLTWIWFHRNQATNSCFPSVQTLCKETGIGRSKVILCINELCRVGLLKRQTRFRDGAQTSNMYTVSLFPVQEGATTPHPCDTPPRPQDGHPPVRAVDTEPEEEEPEDKSEDTLIEGGAGGGRTVKVSDYGRLEAIWKDRCGVVQHGRFRKAVKPVLEAVGAERAAEALARYVESVEPRYLSITSFAAFYKRYLQGGGRPAGAY